MSLLSFYAVDLTRAWHQESILGPAVVLFPGCTCLFTCFHAFWWFLIFGSFFDLMWDCIGVSAALELVLLQGFV